MRQIPSSWLNMSASLYHQNGTDDYSTPIYDDEIELTKIYIEQTKSVTLGSLGEASDGTITLFYDNVVSSPADTTFSRLDKIVFDDEEYQVRSAMPYRNPLTGNIHHWEVTLIGN